ncbi:DUF397 domain-containing protein [Actinophytocola sp. KF-1]
MNSSHGRWVWRTSTFSQGDTNSACVEVGHWRKSSFSQGNGNSACVEVAWAPEATAVRDSKNPDGGMLLVSESGWSAFRTSVTR